MSKPARPSDERGFTDLGASFGYVLRALAAEPLTATQLAARLHLTPQGAAKIADAMVRHGYVERRADPDDARARRLVLAARGQQALRAARAFHQTFERDLATTNGGATALRPGACTRSADFRGDAVTPRDTAARVLRPL